MITSYEVGTIFKIVDRASPVLSELTRMMYRLEESTELTKKNLQSMGNMTLGRLNRGMASLVEKAEVMDRRFKKTFETMDAGTASATRQTKVLANEWRDVAQAARIAGISIANTSRRNAAVAWQGPWGAAPSGPRPGRPSQPSRGSVLGMFGVSARSHAKLPGGTSIGVHGHGFAGQAGLAAAGILGYSVYEAAKVDDALFNILFHTGFDYTDDNKERFRKIIKRTASRTGFGMLEISDAIKEEVRMMRGTPGQGLDILPEMLMSAATEAKAKPGTSLKESMATIIGLAHQGKDYSPEQIKRLAPYFGFLSASTSASLPQLERASGYAAPILQSGMGVDPLETLLFSVALQRAGITNTKSGTWLRAMMQKALPGTTLQSRVAYEHHQTELGELGLIDKTGNSTILNAQGTASILKFVEILSERLKQIPQSRRGTVLTQLFGTQGAGGAAVLADPRVVAQVQELQKEYPAFQRRYSTFFDDYRQNSAAQQARTAWADVQNVLIDIGEVALPPVIAALKSFDKQLRWLDKHWPKPGSMGGLPKKGTLGDALGKGMGEGVVWGAGAGALVGAFGGPTAPVTVPGGTMLGGAIGAVGGGIYEGGRWLFGLGNSDAPASYGAVKTVPVPGGAGSTIGPSTNGFVPDDGASLPRHAKPTMFSPTSYTGDRTSLPSLLHFASYAPSDIGGARARAPGIIGAVGGIAIPSGPTPSGIIRHVTGSKAAGAKRLMHDLMARGWSKEAAAVAAGNAAVESGFNTSNNTGDHGTSWGLMQWHLDRRRNMVAWAQAHGKKWNDWDSQVGFLDHEWRQRFGSASVGSHDLNRLKWMGKRYEGYSTNSFATRNAYTDRFLRLPTAVGEAPTVHPPQQQHAADTSVNLHLDGRVIARSTMKHIAREGNKPARAGRMPDYTAARPINV